MLPSSILSAVINTGLGFVITLKYDISCVNSEEEIARLKKEIEHLKTRVEIESIRAEIYNLKMLATKNK